jgi:ATP-binding protein involved in chromosome partitioning
MLKRTNNEFTASVSAVSDPVLFHPLGELGLVRSVRRGRRALEVLLASPVENYPATAELRRRIADALVDADVGEVIVEHELMDEQQRTALGALLHEIDAERTPAESLVQGQSTARPNPFAEKGSASRVLCIASGKGGVGKSSVTVNLAVALAAAGHSVGLLDADIYGFSVPRMLGVAYPPIVLGKTIVPPVSYGVRCVSIGFFVDEDQAVAWRGPMLHRALEQFLVDVHWGGPEFLVVDMPPGTGDIALSVAQQLPRAEIYVVTTPQPSAERVAQRAGALGRQLKIPVRGVIENMSWFVTPDGARYEPFGSGGGATLAASLGVPLLAQVPLVPAVREGADEGRPAVVADPDGEVAAVFAALGAAIVEAGPTRVYRRELSIS